MVMEQQNITIEQIDISLLNPAPYNPRQFSDQEYKHLKESIQKFGIVDTILANGAPGRKNIIIGGHFRLRVAKDLGFTKVPVVYINIPEIEIEKELNVRLNKNLGAWDLDLLADFDKDILKDIGFTSQEIHRIFDPDLVEDNFDAAAALANIKEPSARLGDIYQLGEHRLMCGDSSKEEDVARLMAGGLARLIFTDPPYNVNYKSPVGLTYNSTKFGGTGGKMFNDNKSEEECFWFYSAVLKNLFKFSTDDVTIYWWFANKNNWINRLAFEEGGWHMSQILMWLKNSSIFSQGVDYHRCYEPVMMGWKKKKVHFKNKKYSNYKDCFNLDYDDWNDMIDVWYQHRDVTTQYIHPTQKPVRLAERALRKNSEMGDIVVDLFCGSASTLIGCEQMDRKCYAMEMDPKYIDVEILRWEAFTGKKAVKIEVLNIK
jgi:DNA modification methylase